MVSSMVPGGRPTSRAPRWGPEMDRDGFVRRAGAVWAQHTRAKRFGCSPLRLFAGRFARFAVVVAAIGTVVASAGCATLFRPVPMELVAITSDPAGAGVFVDGERVGETPMEVSLDRRAAEYGLRLEKDGCARRELEIRRSVSPWAFTPLVGAAAYYGYLYAGPENAGENAGKGLLFIGIVAALLDGWTGARYSLPDAVRVPLCRRDEVDVDLVSLTDSEDREVWTKESVRSLMFGWRDDRVSRTRQ